MRECFHFVSLFKIRKRLMHENKFLHEYCAVICNIPISNISVVNSGCSPITLVGKSIIGILQYNTYLI